MADAPATTSKSNFGFLTKKIGPAPVWVYALIAVGIWYWYTHYGPGKAAGSNASATAVDPSTGVSYAEELAAANQEVADLQGAAGPGAGSSPSPAPGPAPADTGDVSPQTVAEQEQDLQELQKAQQQQPTVSSNWPGGQQPLPITRQPGPKPGTGKRPPPKPVQRHNRTVRARPVPVVVPPGHAVSPPPRRFPVEHPLTPKNPADKETAPMTRWRAA